MSDGAVCRTAPVTPSLLKTAKKNICKKLTGGHWQYKPLNLVYLPEEKNIFLKSHIQTI